MRSPAQIRRLRGALLLPGQAGRVDCIDPGEIVLAPDGTLLEVGRPAADSSGLLDLGAPALLVPGLVDAHVHLPQYTVRGERPGPLLPWLEEVVFPAEAGFADPLLAARRSAEFDQALLAAGTTAAGVYTTVHTGAARAALERLRVRGLVGKVLMDRAAPAALLESAARALPALAALADRYPQRAAVVPRFAVGCTAGLLQAAGALARHRRLPVMTHLAESTEEVRRVHELFPAAASYTEVYARSGLLGPRTLLAHAVHLSGGELQQLRASGAIVVHCPTANEALGSGRLAVEKLREHAIPYVLGTDVGAGPSLSMWHVVASYLRVHRGRAAVTPEEALWRATAGGARALGITGGGELRTGRRVDLVAFARPVGAGAAGGAGGVAAALIGAMAEATAAVPEPQALATWLDGALVHATAAGLEAEGRSGGTAPQKPRHG